MTSRRRERRTPRQPRLPTPPRPANNKSATSCPRRLGGKRPNRRGPLTKVRTVRKSSRRVERPPAPEPDQPAAAAAAPPPATTHPPVKLPPDLQRDYELLEE